MTKQKRSFSVVDVLMYTAIAATLVLVALSPFLMTRDATAETKEQKIAKMLNWLRDTGNSLTNGYNVNTVGATRVNGVVVPNSQFFVNDHANDGPDYSCSSYAYYSLVNAGILTGESANIKNWSTLRLDAFLNKRNDFTRSRYTSMSNLQAGDILIAATEGSNGSLTYHHTAVYAGNGKLYQAMSNKNGKSGQASANAEIGLSNWSENTTGQNFNHWYYVYRYNGNEYADTVPAFAGTRGSVWPNVSTAAAPKKRTGGCKSHIENGETVTCDQMNHDYGSGYTVDTSKLGYGVVGQNSITLSNLDVAAATLTEYDASGNKVTDANSKVFIRSTTKTGGRAAIAYKKDIAGTASATATKINNYFTLVFKDAVTIKSTGAKKSLQVTIRDITYKTPASSTGKKLSGTKASLVLTANSSVSSALQVGLLQDSSNQSYLSIGLKMRINVKILDYDQDAKYLFRFTDLDTRDRTISAVSSASCPLSNSWKGEYVEGIGVGSGFDKTIYTTSLDRTAFSLLKNSSGTAYGIRVKANGKYYDESSNTLKDYCSVPSGKSEEGTDPYTSIGTGFAAWGNLGKNGVSIYLTGSAYSGQTLFTNFSFATVKATVDGGNTSSGKGGTIKRVSTDGSESAMVGKTVKRNAGETEVVSIKPDNGYMIDKIIIKNTTSGGQQAYSMGSFGYKDSTHQERYEKITIPQGLMSPGTLRRGVVGGNVTLYYMGNGVVNIVFPEQHLLYPNLNKQPKFTNYQVDATFKKVGIREISVQSTPTKTSYIQSYEQLDLTGGVIKVKYTDDRESTVAMTNDAVKVTGFSNSTVGEKTLTAKYSNLSTTFKVSVVAPQPTKISVSKLPNQTNYIVNTEQLDLTGGKLKIEYSNNTSSEISMTNSKVTVAGFNNASVGEKTLTATYEGLKTTFKVTITSPQATSISVESMPDQTRYIVNYDTLNLAGGSIRVHYNDGSSSIVPMTNNKVTVGGFSNTSVGDKTLTVRYNGLTTTFTVAVVEATVSSIEVSSLPNKTKYIINRENLDLTGGKIAAHYDNGQTTTVAMTSNKVSVTGFNNGGTGSRVLTVSYSGRTTTFEVFVIDEAPYQVSGMQIVQEPIKKSYIQNYESLDLSGGIVEILLSNGSSTVGIQQSMEALGSSNVSGFNNTTLGEKRITLKYEYDGRVATASFNVTIVPKQIVSMTVQPPVKEEYYHGSSEQLDLTGGYVEVTYSDQSRSRVSLSNSAVSLSGFSTAQLGQRVVTVSYRGHTDTFTVNIVQKTLASLQISDDKLPVKLKYAKGESGPDLTGGVVYKVYSDGSRSPISMTNSNIVATGFNSSVVGKNTITLRLVEGSVSATASFNVDIVSMQIVDAHVAKLPVKRSYLKGKENLDLTGGILAMDYDDGTYSLVAMTNKDVRASGFNNSTTGIQEVNVSYLGRSASFTVNVIDATVESISVSTLPTKIIYEKGREQLDLTGGELEVHDSAGNTSYVSLTNSNVRVTDFDNSEVGEKTLVVAYAGKTTTFKVRIEENGYSDDTVPELRGNIGVDDSTATDQSPDGGKGSSYENASSDNISDEGESENGGLVDNGKNTSGKARIDEDYDFYGEESESSNRKPELPKTPNTYDPIYLSAMIMCFATAVTMVGVKVVGSRR